ncbi:flagellar biosynthesis protein FlgD [Shewanella psychropiezotolerans]|uniref:Basal-body rod modification protein FlgD n=1 Tax=Shewanella psychropiezotolerans TaxID=2593655 RepID=A0ABX5WY48_9GAMM|nr:MULTISPECIES: flagellar hook capping FlgD N-terminal domain-containing protein [Shewanella]MPY25276.1 flagellar biosynthesis protein FlgD [Shewanella sp. YLB-07]QDO81951.1 flagellar biosynthesis protein FlgD [Shewanella psychropiezotolerans]
MSINTVSNQNETKQGNNPEIKASSGGATQSTSTSSSDGNAATIKNDFLTLMLASIQNQDPTSPVDNNEFVTQMAQISQVESLEMMRANQAMSMIMMENLGIVQSAQLIGKSAMVPASEFEIDTDAIDGKIYLENTTEELTLEITDEDGEVVATIDLGSQETGDIAFTIDPDKLDLPPGEYAIKAKATDGEDTLTADTFIKAPIEKVHFVSASGVMMAELGNGLGTVSVLDISEVS